jgi:hypothetical protein
MQATATNLINLKTTRKALRQARAKGITFCRSGFHHWQILKDRRFEVRSGKLLTVERCARCQAERTRLL